MADALMLSHLEHVQVGELQSATGQFAKYVMSFPVEKKTVQKQTHKFNLVISSKSSKNQLEERVRQKK